MTSDQALRKNASRPGGGRVGRAEGANFEIVLQNLAKPLVSVKNNLGSTVAQPNGFCCARPNIGIPNLLLMKWEALSIEDNAHPAAPWGYLEDEYSKTP